MAFNFGATSGGFSFGASSSGPSTTSSTAPSSGFIFGTTPSSSSAPSTSTSIGFGPSSKSISAASSEISSTSATDAPAASKTDAGTTPSLGLGFGATVPEAQAKTTSGFGFNTVSTEAKPTSGFNFGTASMEAKPIAPESSGFNFGAKRSATEATSGDTTTTTPVSTGGFNFGGTASNTAKPVEAEPATTGFSFGGASTTGLFTAESQTATTTSSFGFGVSTSTGTTSGTTSTATTTAMTTLPVTETDKPPAEYMGRTIEDIINAWSEQLERNADTFTTEAVKVSKWDSDLVDSQRKLGDIAGDVRRIQVAQNELDTNLDTIFAYQMELKSTLEQLEKSVDKMYESQDQMPVAADIEREQTLQLSVDIDDQVNSMTTTLKETVEKLNMAQDDVADENNPIVQIMKVLNVHHNSLQWIEGTSGRINSEIAQLSRKLQNSSI